MGLHNGPRPVTIRPITLHPPEMTKSDMLLRACVFAVAVSSGCSEMFRAHVTDVARVDDQTLQVEDLAELMILGQPLPLTVDVAREMADHWVNVTALASRLASGDSLWGESFVRDVMWLNIRQLGVSRWRQRLADEGLVIGPSAVDSSYRVGEHRLVAHILRAVPPDATPEVRQQQRATAERIRNQLIAGVSWEEASLQNEDSLTRESNGSLGVTARGTFVPRFENVAYELGPGELSPVVETQAGYHLIFRPELVNVREPFTTFVEQALRVRFDSAYTEAVARTRNVQLADDAAETLREIARAPFRRTNGSRAVVTYDGGALSEERLAQYVRLLPGTTRREMLAATDRDLSRFVRGRALEELLWMQADSAGLNPSDSTVALMTENYRSELQRLWNQMGLSPDSLRLTAEGQTSRDRTAELVARYFDAAVSRRIPLQTIPPFLVAHLRGATSWEIRQPALMDAVAMAQRLQAGADMVLPDEGNR